VTLPPGDKSFSHGIGGARHHDGDGARGVPRCDGHGRVPGEDDVDVSRDQFGCEGWVPIWLPLCASELDHHIPTDDVAVRRKSLHESSLATLDSGVKSGLDP
jgi:hypothetical protein